MALSQLPLFRPAVLLKAQNLLGLTRTFGVIGKATVWLGVLPFFLATYPQQEPHLSLVLEEIATSYFFQLTTITGVESRPFQWDLWSCGFQPSPPLVSPSAANVVLDLPAIDRIISSLQSARAAKPYEKQKSSLHLELESFYPPFRPPSLLFLLPLKMSLDFLCGRITRERPRFTCLAVLSFGTRSKLKCGCPSRLASGTVDNTIGKLRSIFNSIGRSGDWSGLSPGNPAAHQSIKKYLASISEEQAQKDYIVSRDLAFFCLDFNSGDRASDLGRVYTKEVLLLPEKQGLLFHHTFGKTLRGKYSNIFTIKTCLHDSIVCPVVNLTTYVKLADLMTINLRDGFLFRATDAKGRVSSSPFVGSTVANRLRLHLTTLNIFQGETMHSFRSGCSITLSLLGASDDQVARHVGWKSIQTAQYYSQVSKVMELSLPASLLAQGSVKGKDNVSHAESVSAEFRARNDLEGLALAFP
ncbi:hypothetical protein OS493_019318 [Desmophyllum pertusum]|uniref:ALOG domain-containing protein n=1 Tax=Desmophyllum pertusum TaxID=174260 RepID=A0A9X0A0M5_9CNID|nr:hypothetical protein OS493_019318 [Desmophyllum pertusum]